MYTDYKDRLAQVMVSEEEIDKAVTRIAYEIEEDFKNSDKKLLLLGKILPIMGLVLLGRIKIEVINLTKLLILPVPDR